MSNGAFFLILVFLLWIEWYAFQATRTLIANKSDRFKKTVRLAYAIQAVLSFGLVFYATFLQTGTVSFSFLLSTIFMIYTAKLVAMVVIFIDDFRRVIKWFGISSRNMSANWCSNSSPAACP